MSYTPRILLRHRRKPSARPWFRWDQNPVTWIDTDVPRQSVHPARIVDSPLELCDRIWCDRRGEPLHYLNHTHRSH